MNEDNRRKIYDMMYDTGLRSTYDEFVVVLGNEKKRKKIYDIIKSDAGYDKSYDDFEAEIGVSNASAEAAPAGSVSQQVIDEYDASMRNAKPVNPTTTPTNDGSQFAQALQEPDWRSDETKLLDEIATSGKATVETLDGEERYPTKPIEVRYDESVQDARNQAVNHKNDAANQLNSLYEDIKKQVDAIPRRVPRPYEAMAGLTEQQLEENRLRAAKRLVEDAKEVLEEAGRKGKTSFIAGLGRGIADKIADPENWNFGITDLADNKYLLDALKKSDNGEELTPAEDKLLQAATTSMAVNYYYSQDLGRGYKAGKTTAESIPFMLEFMINPISQSGSGIAKSLLKYGMKKFGAKAVNRGVTRAAGRLIGDAAAAAGMTATTGAANTLASAYEKQVGNYDYRYDDNGNVVVQKTGDMGEGEALARGFLSTFLENQSEMVFGAFAGAGKALSEIVPYISKLSDNGLVRFYNSIKNAPLAKQLRERAEIGGVVEEYAEEVYNNLANVAIGEMTAEDALSVDNNIDTFLGLVPTQLAFSAIGLGGLARENMAARRRLQAFTSKLSEEERSRFAELQEAVRSGDNNITRDYIKAVLADPSLSEEEKKERIFAAKDLVTEQQADEIEQEQPAEEQEAAASYAEGAAADPSTYYERYKASRSAGSALMQADANLYETINRYVDDDASAGEVENLLSGLEGETEQLARNYLNSLMQLKGAEDAQMQAAVEAVELFDKSVRKYCVYNYDDGTRSITTGTYKGLPVYVLPGIGDNVLVANDDGVREFALSKYVENQSTSDYDELIDNYSRDYLTSKEQEFRQKLENHPKTQEPAPGLVLHNGDMTYIVTDVSEDGYVDIVPAYYDPESGRNYAKEDSSIQTISRETAMMLQNDYYNAIDDTPESPVQTGNDNNLSENQAENESGSSGGESNVSEQEQVDAKSVLSASQKEIESLRNAGASEESISNTITQRFNNAKKAYEKAKKAINAPFKEGVDPVTEIQKRKNALYAAKSEYEEWEKIAPVQEKVDNLSENQANNDRSTHESESNVSEERQEDTPEQRLANLVASLPKKGNTEEIDYNAMTPQQRYEYTSLTESPETAAQDLQADIKAKQKELDDMQKKLDNSVGGKRTELRDKMRKVRSELSELTDYYQGIATEDQTGSQRQPEGYSANTREVVSEDLNDVQNEEDYLEWVADESEDALEVASAYNLAKEMASRELKLNPWQQELLGTHVNTDSFKRFGDRNLITGTLAKSWLRKDGRDLDILAQELSVQTGMQVTEQDIVDFMLAHPSNRVSQTSNIMTRLAKKFSNIASAEMKFPVGGPESNTGRLYIRLKEAGQKVDELTEQQTREAEGAFAEDIQDNASDIAAVDDAITEEYAVLYDEALGRMDEEEADRIAVEELEKEPLYEGMTAEELDDIYSSLEYQQYGTEGQRTDSEQVPAEQVQEGTGESETSENERVLPEDDSQNGAEDSGTERTEVANPEELLPESPESANERRMNQIIERLDEIEYRLSELEGKTDIFSEAEVITLNNEKDELESEYDGLRRINATSEAIQEAREEVNTSPTEAQKEAGNYKKGHVSIDGLDVSIENPKGSVRSGVDADGNAWSVTMQNDYGYIRGTKAVDGDHIDIFLSDSPATGNVYVVDAIDQQTGAFDESKVMYGFNSMEEARDAYLSNYSEGWKVGPITEVSKEEFKKWVDSSKRKGKPFSEYKSVKEIEAQNKQQDTANENQPNLSTKKPEKTEQEEVQVESKDKFVGYKEFIENLFEQEELSLTPYKNLSEWKEKDEEFYANRYDARIDEFIKRYVSYIKELSDNGTLQRIYDHSSLKNQKVIRDNLADAGIEYKDYIDTKVNRKRIPQKADEKSDLKEGSEVNARFYDGTIVSGTIESIENNKIGIRANNGRLYNVPLNRILDNDDNVLFREVYHGSPADFDRFDHNFMGSGEGAQAYGWGTYVTEVNGIARSYAENLTGRDYTKQINRLAQHIEAQKEFIKTRKADIRKNEDYEKYAKSIRKNLRDSQKEYKSAERAGNEKDMEFYQSLINISNQQLEPEHHKHLIDSFWDDINNAQADIDKSNAEMSDLKNKLKDLKGKRNLYTVEIPEDTGENYLDWEQPISDNQAKMIEDAAKQEFDDEMVDKIMRPVVKSNEFKRVYAILSDKSRLGSDKAVSEFLSRAGFTGIKYPAEATTGGRADGARNYVIFNDKDLEITEHLRFRESLNEVNERFNEELSRYQEGKMETNDLFHLGNPHGVMRMFLPNLPIVMRQRVVKKGSEKKHDVPLQSIIDMPSMISNPIFVFQRDANSIGILTDMTDNDGKNVCVAIELGKTIQNGNEYLEVNDIRSFHGREVKYVVEPIVYNNTLRYANKSKGLAWLSSASQPVQQEIDKQDLSSATKIVENFENPKLEETNFREGQGSQTDASISLANDPASGIEGATRRSSKQQEEYAARERRRMENAANRMVEKLGLDNVEIVTDASTLKGDKAKAKGFYSPSTGKITIVLPNHVSSFDVEQTILHEAVAHYGLRRLFGDNFDTFLDNVYNNASAEIRERINKLAKKYNGNYRTATEEYLASLAENTDFENAVHSDWFDKIKTFFLKMLAKVGINLPELTDNELRYILWRSYENMAHPGRYSNVFDEAADVAMQNELKVGNYAEVYSSGNAAAEGVQDTKAERIEKLRNSKSVEIAGNEVEPSDDLKQYRKNANEYGLNNLRGYYVNKDTGKSINVSKSSIKEVTSHDASPVQFQSVAAIPQILENSIFIDTAKNEDMRKHGDVSSYDYYVCGLRIGGVDYTVKAVIANGYNGEKYYDHRLTQIEKGELISLAAAMQNHGSEINSPLSDIKDKRLISILQENNEKDTASDDDVLFRTSSVDELLDDWNKYVENGPQIYQISSEADIDRLPYNSFTKRELKDKLNDRWCTGAYSNRNGAIFLFPDHITGNAEELELTLWHETAHYASRQLGLDERLKNACLDYIKSRYPETYREITENYDRSRWPEEAVAHLFERKIKEFGAKKMLSSTFAGESVVAETFTQLINFIKNGKGNTQSGRDSGSTGNASGENVEGSTFRGRRNDVLDERRKEREGKEGGDETDIFDDEQLNIVNKEVGAAREQYERTLNTASYKFTEAWQDSMLGLKEAQDAIAKATKSKILDYENAYLAENALSSKNLAEMDAYRNLVFKPILEEVNKLKKQGAGYEEITDYLMLKHGIERNREMAVRKALEEDNETAEENLQRWNEEKNAILASSGTWEDKQRQLDELALTYGAEMKDYSGMTEMLPEYDDMESITNEAYRRVNEFESKYNTEELYKRIGAANEATLKKQVESGLMSKEMYQNISRMYQFYVPLRGWEQKTADEVYDYLTTEHSSFNAPIRTAKGRKSKADDPIATIANMAESGIIQGNKNLVKQRFLTMVQNHRTDLASINELWVRENENGEWTAIFPDIPDKATPEEVEKIVEAFNARMEEKSKEEKSDVKRASDMANVPYKILPRDLKEHQMVVKRSGKPYVVTINGNPRAAQAVNGLTNPNSTENPMIKALESANRFMASNFTQRNPAFVVSNMVRDGIYSNTSVWVKESPLYAAKYNQNWAKSVKEMGGLVRRYKSNTLDMSNPTDRMFYEFIMNGGETGYTFINSVEDYKGIIQKEIKRANRKTLSPGKALDVLGSAMDTFGRWAEDASRFAAYRTSREMGRSVTRSVNDAKEISVNFNKKGAGAKTAGKWEKGNRINALQAWASQTARGLYIFWNAGVQGLTNFARLAKQNPGKFSAAAATYLTLGSLAPLINEALCSALGGDDDDANYYNLPEYVRRNNICIYLGGSWLTIPLPIELRALYGLGELASSVLSGKEKYQTGKVAGQVSQILPIDMLEGSGGLNNLLPSYYKPIHEAYVANKSWTGIPIYKENDFNRNMPEWTKAYKSTSPELIELGSILNEWSGGTKYRKGYVDINPARIEYLFSSYLGGIATTIDQIKKTAMMPFNEDMQDLRNVPVLSRFLKNADSRSTQKRIDNDYYENKKDFDLFRQELNGYKKELKSLNSKTDDFAEYLRLYNELINSEKYRKFQMFNEMDKSLKKMGDVFKNTGDEELEKQMYVLKEAMNEVAK